MFDKFVWLYLFLTPYEKHVVFLSTLHTNKQFADTMSAKGVTEPWMANWLRLRSIYIIYIKGLRKNNV